MEQHLNSFSSLKLYPWQYLMLGVQVSKEISGMRLLVLRCLLVNLVIMLLITGGLSFSIYYYALQPLMDLAQAYLPAWMVGTSTVLVWVMQIIVIMLLVIFAVRISFILLGVWYENLVEKVIGHHRTLPEMPFDLKAQIHSLGMTVVGLMREIFFILLLLT